MFLIVSAVVEELFARLPISLATTANPRPASPALAASIDAFKDKRFVWLDNSRISATSVLICDNS